MKEAIAIAAKNAHDVLTSPPTGISNVTEWAKQEACWTQVQSLKILWPTTWLNELIGKDQVAESRRTSVRNQKQLNGIEAQTVVVNTGSDVWKQLKEWGEARKLLSPNESNILSIAANMPKKIPTDKQSIGLLSLVQKLVEEGCQTAKNIAY